MADFFGDFFLIAIGAFSGGILAGIFMDGFMAIIVTTLLETKGIGLAYSGTALGIVFTIGQIGTVSSPPLGNNLANISAGAPFNFWAALSVIALIMLFFVKETGPGRHRLQVPNR